MKKNYNQRLTLLLAIQMIMMAILWWPRSSSTGVENVLMADLPETSISKILFEGKEGIVQIEKLGGSWIIPDLFNYVADAKKVDDLLSKIKTSKLGLAVGKSKASHERFEVSDEKFQRRVSFFEGEKKDHGFYLGSSPQHRQAHYRRFGDQDVYTTTDLAAYQLPLKPVDWIDRNLTQIPTEKLTMLDVQRGKEKLRFEAKEESKKDDKGQTNTEKVWYVNGALADKTKLDSILRNITNLRLTDVLGKKEKPEFGLKNPKVMVTLHWKTEAGHQQKTFVIGSKQDNDYVLKDMNAPFVFLAGGYQLEALVSSPKNEFKK